MLSCYDKENSLKNIVKIHGLHRKNKFREINIKKINNFPKHDREILKREIIFGSFQLKLTPTNFKRVFQKSRIFSQIENYQNLTNQK